MKNLVSKTVSTVKNYKVFIALGALLIGAAGLVIASPGESYQVLSVIFSVAILASGIAYSYFAISNRKYVEGYGWYLFGGIVEIAMGVILLMYPDLAMATMPIFIGFWILFSGAKMISNSMDLKRYGVMDWGYLMLLGVLLTSMGFMMALNPIYGAFNVLFLASLSLLTAGVAQIKFGLQLRKIKRAVKQVKEDVRTAFTNEINRIKDVVDQVARELSEEQQRKIDEAFNNPTPQATS